MKELFIGIMSGTSLDGADVVLASFDEAGRPQLVAAANAPFASDLRAELAALQASGPDELHRAALAANRLVDFHASLVRQVCRDGGVDPASISAIGAHGQTVRHQPAQGYTIQVNAPARLAEATGIRVVADFRSRDVAAGGQGAPLVPAFHAALFRVPGRHRAVLNLGGMSNVTDLPAAPDVPVRGWDCGPGNVLLDGWIADHRQTSYDASGRWAASGRVDAVLLGRLRAEPWLALPPPKSTGREQFDRRWLRERLDGFDPIAAVDVQATLAEFTAAVVADSVAAHAGRPDEVIVCGGGAHNADLLARLHRRMAPAVVSTSAEHGIAPEHIEALAFAWLAMRCLHDQPGNLPAVTGARGLRILGAIHPR